MDVVPFGTELFMWVSARACIVVLRILHFSTSIMTDYEGKLIFGTAKKVPLPYTATSFRRLKRTLFSGEDEK